MRFHTFDRHGPTRRRCLVGRLQFGKFGQRRYIYLWQDGNAADAGQVCVVPFRHHWRTIVAPGTVGIFALARIALLVSTVGDARQGGA